MGGVVWIIPIFALLAACAAFEPPPTPTPTRALSGPTLEASPVVRGVVPTLPAVEYIGQNDPTAAAMPSGGDLPPLIVGASADGSGAQAVQIAMGDGALIDGDLYPALSGERVPGILLLAPDRAAWLDLPLRLQAVGFTALTMDVRDVTNLGDFSVMLRSLSDAGTVDPASLAVVGAESGADLALSGCANDLLCDAVVLLTPTDPTALASAIQRYNPRPLFVAAGRDDAPGIATAGALAEAAFGAVQFEQVDGALRGAFLVQGSSTLGAAVIDWLEAQLSAR